MPSARVCKALLARGVVITGIAALARRRHHAKLRILMYHGVVPQRCGPTAWGDLFIREEDFARQMRHLRRAFDVMSLDQALACVGTRQRFPDRAVVVTMDDGYRNTITTTLPILKALGVPVTVFVPAGLVVGGSFLWFDALRVLVATRGSRSGDVELGSGLAIDGRADLEPEAAFATLVQRILSLPAIAAARVQARLSAVSREEGWSERYPEFALAGWEEWRRVVADGLITVGSHGCSHGNLLRMSPAEQLQDLRESKRRIEQELSRPCRAVAYPYGAWSEEVAEAAREAGYACAMTTDDGLNTLESNRLALRRTMVGDKGDFYLFCARMSGVWHGLRSVAALR